MPCEGWLKLIDLTSSCTDEAWLYFTCKGPFVILLFQPTDSADSTSLLWHASSKSFIHCLTWIWNLCVPDFPIKLHVTMLIDFLFEFLKMYNYLLAVLFWNTLWPGKYILFLNLSVNLTSVQCILLYSVDPSSLVIVSGACGMHVCNFQYATILNFTWSEISENIKHVLVIYNHNFSSLLLSLFAKMHHFNCSDGTAFKCKLTSFSWLFALTWWPLTRLAMCRQEVMVKLVTCILQTTKIRWKSLWAGWCAGHSTNWIVIWQESHQGLPG